MAVNETIVTGRKFRKLIDAANKQWQRISFWHKASDCEFDDGDTAETKVGAIKGLTSDLNTTTTGYAADMTTVAELNSSLVSDIYVGEDKKLHKIIGGADSVLNFSKTTALYYGLYVKYGTHRITTESKPKFIYAYTSVTTFAIYSDGTIFQEENSSNKNIAVSNITDDGFDITQKGNDSGNHFILYAL